MSIASEITRLQNAKADIKTAIEAKGVTVPSSAKIDTYDTYVAQISGGGGTDRLPQLLNNTITSISASDFVNTTKVKSYIFSQCTNLSSVTLPSNITEIGTSAFENCTSLSNLIIPSGVTKLGTATFQGCASLTSITIPSGVKAIYQSLFQGCTSLTTITINGNITRLYPSCFQNCSALTTISSLPTTLTNIDSSIFSGCTLLTELSYQGTMAQWNAITKNSNWNRNSALTTIHCSDGDITL